MFKFLFVLSAMIGLSTAEARILIEDSLVGAKSKIAAKQSGFSDELKSIKKVGVGTTLAGSTGLFGVNLHVNFAKDFTFVLGAGESRGFHAFNMHFKKIFSSGFVQPYFSGGYSRWFSNDKGESVDKTSPSVLVKKFLSKKEINRGEFSENILYPGLGVEFLTLSGNWQGLSFFVEALMLLDIDDLQTGATAGIGSVYYF